MSSVTQKVPNYVLGISTQPDEKKLPGQVVELKNAVPDVVRQLTKRPGSHLVRKLTESGTETETKWFNIYTKSDEQYIGQCSPAGVVKVWRCSDGVEIPIDYAKVPGTGKATYLDNSGLSDEKSSDIQVQTINETTFFVNRRKDTAMKTGVLDKSAPQLNEAFVSLDTISYGKQYALDIFDPADNTTYSTKRVTSIAVDDSYSYSGTSNGDCKGMGRETVRVSSGTDPFGTSPPNMSASGKKRMRYEIDTRCTPQIDSGHSTEEAMDNYHDTYQAFVKLQFGGEGAWSTSSEHQFTSEKGVTTTTKVKSVETVISRCGIAGVRPEATSSTAEEHVSAIGILSGIKSTLDSITGDHGVVSTICGNGIHFFRHQAFGVTTPEKTLMTITTTEANNIADLPRVCRHGYTVRVVNSGEDMDDYYLRFQAEGVNADIVQNGTYARSGNTVTVTTVLDHGIANGSQVILDMIGHGSGTAGDGYFTVASVPSGKTFTVTHGSSGTASGSLFIHPVRFGEGVWEEVAAPDIETTLDNDTMPLKLTRANPGTYDTINGGNGTTSYPNGFFRFDYPDWGERDVGDDITNSKPTFVGKPIQKLGFYRNRIAILSEENIILSRVNDFYNFWVKTAMAISNADPIDLQSSSTFPTKLFDAVENNAGLVLFSASEQFILNSGAEALLTPETAKVSYLASYAFNPDTRPFSLGTTIGFLNSTARNARFYEMGGISATSDPQIQEQSKIISNLFPTNTSLPAESTENDMILFAVDGSLHTATDTVYGYKYYTQGDKRVQSAWFKWTMPNVIAYHTIMDDIYYTILQNDTTFTLERFDLKLNADTLMIGTSPDENRIHLDTKKTFSHNSITYTASTDKSSFALGEGFVSSNTLTAYTATDSDDAGRSYDITSSDISGTGDNRTITLPGNWKASTKNGSAVDTNVIVGYEYEMEVQLPKIYMTQMSGDQMNTDTRGSLIIHRLNFAFGDVGVIDVTLKRKGRNDYTNTYESIEWDNYKTDEKSIADDYIHTIPVYDRNTNLDVILKSNHPSPASVHSMNWEGAYSPRYYQRV